MKSQSNINQQPFTINELSNGMAEVMFCENITEAVVGEQTMYEFDMYEIMIPQRIGLADDITANYQEWLNYAKGQVDKPLSDKEKIVELETKLSIQDAVLTELILGGAM